MTYQEALRKYGKLAYETGQTLEFKVIKRFGSRKWRIFLRRLSEHGEDEIRVITAITAYLTQLYMFNIYIRVNGTPNALEILGYPAPKFVVDEKAALSLKFKPNTYYKYYVCKIPKDFMCYIK